MQIFYRLFLASLFSVAQVYATDQTFLTCPSAVKCQSTSIDSCYPIDNPYKIWAKPENGEKIQAGTYHFSEVRYSGLINKPTCSYTLNAKQVIPITVSRDSKYFNIFEPFLKDGFKWIKKSSSDLKCLSDNPNLCPLIETPEITVLYDSYLKFYYPNPSPQRGDYYKTFDRLSYLELTELCGITNHCLINIGNCDSWGFSCSHFGDIDLDISTNQVVINQITTDEVDNHYCQLQQKKPFNTIFCGKKE